MTAIAASPTERTGWWLVLAGIFVASSTACLLVWAAAGAALARWLTRPDVAMWVDRAMGAILLATAIMLVAL
jgi:threonine/homoserine/homoserine lactone efflux protein